MEVSGPKIKEYAIDATREDSLSKKKKAPFKDAEVNPEAPKLDLRIVGGLTWGFIWFHRKVIIGLILLVGLGGWIYQSQLSKFKAESNADNTVRADQFMDASKPIDPIKRMTDGMSAPFEIPKTEIGLANSDNGNSKPNLPQKKSKFDRFLETAAVEELIDKSLLLREESKKVSPPMAYVIFSERLKLARRLMEMETSEKERFYAINSYLESISILDSLNIEDNLNITGTEAAIKEIEQTFCNHPNRAIAAKANLTVLIRPVYLCLTTRDVDMLNVFKDGFDQRMEVILSDETSARRLAEVTVLLVERLYDEEKETLAVAKHILNFFEQSTDPRIKQIAGSFREKLYFGRLGLGDILRRIEVDDPETRDNVQELFVALAENPESRAELIQLAFSTIQVYHVVGKTEDAKALLKWYLEIVDTMPDQEQKAKVIETVDHWKSSVGM